MEYYEMPDGQNFDFDEEDEQVNVAERDHQAHALPDTVPMEADRGRGSREETLGPCSSASRSEPCPEPPGDSRGEERVAEANKASGFVRSGHQMFMIEKSRWLTVNSFQAAPRGLGTTPD